MIPVYYKLQASLAIHPCDVVLKQVQKKQFRGYFVFVSVHSGLAARGGTASPVQGGRQASWIHNLDNIEITREGLSSEKAELHG